jgi:predicted PurR-regulated permease PerM
MSDEKAKAPSGENEPRGKPVGFLNIRARVPEAAITGLFVLAVVYTLYFAQALFIPVFFAILLNLLLSPAVDTLEKIRIPRILGSALVIIALLFVVTASFSIFYRPAADWIERAPKSLRTVEKKLRFITKPVEKIGEATKGVEEIVDIGSKPGGATVAVGKTGFLNRLIYETSELVFGLATGIILLYFLLVSGDMFLRKVINVLPTLSDKKKAVELARRIESDISVYLYTVVAINICLGVVVGAAMYALGMPSPFLWGLVAGLLNFIMYIGPVVGITVIALAAIISFDSVTEALLPPLAYFLINGIEGNFITPFILGRRLVMNPIVIFLALLFWGWLWGVPGALIAVPIVVILKIICDNTESLKPVGEFLGR